VGPLWHGAYEPVTKSTAEVSSALRSQWQSQPDLSSEERWLALVGAVGELKKNGKMALFVSARLAALR
jgi:hypothetical protein